MYSPKIKPDLIPMLYRIKQAQGGKPMTQIVDEMLRPAVLTLHESLSLSDSDSTGQRGYSNPSVLTGTG
jgi:hypothetical protein